MSASRTATTNNYDTPTGPNNRGPDILEPERRHQPGAAARLGRRPIPATPQAAHQARDRHDDQQAPQPHQHDQGPSRRHRNGGESSRTQGSTQQGASSRHRGSSRQAGGRKVQYPNRRRRDWKEDTGHYDHPHPRQGPSQRMYERRPIGLTRIAMVSDGPRRSDRRSTPSTGGRSLPPVALSGVVLLSTPQRGRSPRHLPSEAPAWQGRSERRVLCTRASEDAARRCAAAGRWRGPESNRRHHDFQSCALPTELPRLEQPDDGSGAAGARGGRRR